MNRMLKVCISNITLLALSILICLNGFAAVDAEGADYFEKIEILKLFNIVEATLDETVFVPEKTVKRAEFAQYFARFLNITDTNTEELYYHDIPDTHYAYDDISALTKLGYMSGVGEKRFAPEEAMKTEFSYGMFLKALGFGDAVKDMSQSEMRVTCLRMGVLDGASQIGAELSVGNLFTMMYNALFAECYGMDRGDFVKTDTMFMELTRDMKYAGKGLVTCAKGMDINGGEVEDDTVIIDRLEYTPPDFDIDECLGRYVKFIYKKASKNSDTEGEIVWMKPVKDNDILNITVTPDCSYNPSNGYLCYIDDKNKDAKVYIPDNITMVYNGRFRKNDIKSVLDNDRYELTLIKGKSGYTTAVVWEYRNIVVKSVSEYDKIVYGKNIGDSLLLNPNQYERLEIIGADGSNIDFGGIAAGDVLSVYESEDKKYSKIYVTSKKLNGKLTAVDGNEIEVMGDRAEFYTQNTDIDKRVGETLTFFVDVKGFIVDFETASPSELAVGFLIKCVMSDSGLSGRLALKILTSGGKVEKYESADKIYVDDISFGSNTDGAFDMLCKGAKSVEPQMIAFKLNSESKIQRIYTAHEDDGGNHALIINKRIQKRDTDTSVYQYAYYTQGSGRLGRTMAVGPDTKVFHVPDEATVGTADDKYFKVQRLTEGVYESAVSYRTSADDKFFEEYILIRNNSIDNDLSDWSAMFDSVYQTLDADGNVIDMVKLYTYEGVEKEIELDEDYDISSMGYMRGDIVRYSVNLMSGKLNQLETIYQPSKNIVKTIGDVTEEHRILFGYVNEVDEGGIKIGYESGVDFDEILNMATPGIERIIIYDSEIDEITIGTYADLKPYNLYGKDCSVVIAGTNWTRLMHVFAHR